MSLFDPKRPRLAAFMLVLGFAAIAVIAFLGGWMVGTAFKPWLAGWAGS
jgi:hypothetical protein